MYQYSIKADESNNVLEKTLKSQQLSDEFDKIDKRFSDLTNSDVELNLEKINYERPTEEAVKTSAENYLKSFKDSSIDKINSDYQKQEDILSSNINTLNEDKKQKESDIKELYSSAKESESNDALKRGLARSSIVIERRNALDDEMITKISDLSRDVSNKINELNSQVDLLESQKQAALSSFDIEYAIKLQDKIDSINNDLFEKEQKIIKYNNEIKQIEAKHQQEQDEQNFNNITNLAEIYAKYGTGVVDEIKNGQKYVVAKQFFENMSKEDALSELENNAMYKSRLGSYYLKLLNEIKAK